MNLSESLIILIDKLSQPCDLFGSRFFIIAKMSASLISRDERYFSVFRQKGSKELLFSRGVHWEAKFFLKRLAFSEKFEIILLLTNKGGIIGVFLLFTKRLIIFQYVLGSVEGSISFWLNWLMHFYFASEIVFVHLFDNALTWTKSESFLPPLKYFLVNFTRLILHVFANG